jgi:hypothetical protein
MITAYVRRAARFSRPPPELRNFDLSKRKFFSSTFHAAISTMAEYSATVSKTDQGGPSPEDAAKREHHVKGQNGETVKFRFPHPSMTDMWREISCLGMTRVGVW